MLTTQETEYLCRVGPGTPMGNLMRRFWHPVLLAKELPGPDCPPLRSRILGEDLVAYRDSNGKVGLLDNNCPHRRASLFFGRNEEAGLRCVYHGWKFDTSGACVDMPSEPAESNFKDKVKIKAYPVKEAGELIWAYMGPPELEPPLPMLEYNSLGADQVSVSKLRYESNYVQVVEGDIDTVHASLLHSRLSALDDAPTATSLAGKYSYPDRAPKFFVEDTDGGILIGARRRAEEDSYYWRISRWLFPYFTMIPREPHGITQGGAMVPIDDENCWFVHIRWNPYGPLTEDQRYENNFDLNIRRRRFMAGHRQPPQRLPHRPGEAADRVLHRHRLCAGAGLRHDGQHGHHRRPLQGAPGDDRHGDHPHAPASHQGGPGVGGRRRAVPAAPHPSPTRCAPADACSQEMYTSPKTPRSWPTSP